MQKTAMKMVQRKGERQLTCNDTCAAIHAAESKECRQEGIIPAIEGQKDASKPKY